MGKIKLRLIASLLLLVIALAMVATVSYAWMTISENPAANGISVALSGGTTILLAPDLTKKTKEGNIIHYPGTFVNSLILSQYESYNYLNDLGGLQPVSTADGLNWILPTYDKETGALNEITEFAVDNMLAYANEGRYGNGRYIYLDFWIVSPGSEYNVRVSVDRNGNSGSFLMELPFVIESENSLGYGLTEGAGTVAASARIGFLVNESAVTSNAEMEAYVDSPGYDSRYHSLSGLYPEKGEAPLNEAYRFTVYEPNALLHPSGIAAEGTYVATSPLSWDPDTETVQVSEEKPVSTVQGNSYWALKENGGIQLESVLQTALAGRVVQSAAEAEKYLYQRQLQGQVGSYLHKGTLVKSMRELYEMTDSANGKVAQEQMEGLLGAGATKDAVIVTLKRDEPQRIRMFLWLEGQDADCTNQNSAFQCAGLALGIELAGATQ